MPFGIILLILSFICYNFLGGGGWKGLTLSIPKKCHNFVGLERVKPFQPPKIVAYEEQN
jgi:hypothetical protein